jgi:histone H3/H4
VCLCRLLWSKYKSQPAYSKNEEGFSDRELHLFVGASTLALHNGHRLCQKDSPEKIMDKSGTYAPQSPDLSGFFSSKTQPPYNPQPNPPSTAYAPRSPSFAADPPLQFNHPHNLHAYQHNQPAFGGVINDFEYGGSSQYMLPIPDLPASHSFPNANLPPAPPYYPAQQSHPDIKNEFYSGGGDYNLTPSMSSRGPRIKSDPSSFMQAGAPPAFKDPNPNNIEIKTKFPVARIKRIMQADEEVGKVAQVTPVAVSKALELFMIALVGGAAEIAKEKGQKRVTAQHLKAVVLAAPEQFDFLADIVGRVSEAQEGAGGDGKKRKEKAPADSDSSEEDKKPKKGRGRRKKSDD